MKKIALIALVLLVMVGCAETAPVVEVDTPSFVDGQATALTIEKIQRDLGFRGKLSLELSYVCVNLRNSLFDYQHILDTYPEYYPSLIEKYEGNGVWKVSLEPPPSNAFSSENFEWYERDYEAIGSPIFEWKVYESTATVATAGNHFPRATPNARTKKAEWRVTRTIC